MSFHRHMTERRYGLSHTTAFYSALVFDPIFTPIFTAIGFSTVGIAGTTISAVSIASAIATTAVTMGLQMLMAPKPPKPEDGKAPKTQSVPYRQWAVGTNRLAGAYMLWESRGKNLYSVQALVGHPISGIQKFWLHDDPVELSDLDANGRTTFTSKRYENNVTIQWRLGTETGSARIYQRLVDDFASMPAGERPWTANHKGVGQASAMMICASTSATKQQKRFPYGQPSLSALVDGAKCWDFRQSGQSPTNPSTWTFTKNAAVILAWHLCFNEFGERLDYQKALLPVIDLWKEEADICDENVPRKGGGFEKRYECNGWDTAENSPKAGTNAILATCDGHLVARGDGARILTVGKFRESRCVTLTDDDVMGYQSQSDVLFEDETNRLIPKFCYPDIGYSTADTDYFENTAAQLEAGRVLAQEAEYLWVQQWRQARRLGIREWRRIRQKVRGTIDVRLAGTNAAYSRWIRLATPNSMPRLNGAVIENRKTVVSLMKAAFTMDFVQHPSNIDAWDPNTDEGTQPPVPLNPSTPGLLVPVVNLIQVKSRDNSVYLRVDILDPQDDSLTPVVRYRLKDDGSGNPGAWVSQDFANATPASGVVKLNTNVVPNNEILQVEVAFKDADGDEGDWGIRNEILAAVDPTAPAAANALSFTGGQFSARAANTTASQGRTAYLTFKAGTTAQSFAAATLIDKLAASPGDVRYVTPASAGGATRRLWVQPENVSGVTGPTSYIDVAVP